MANMVWGVEAIVPSQTGQGMSGYEASRTREPEPPQMIEDESVRIRYVAGTTVPKNWIPFISMHAEGSVSEIRLQRARMAGGDPPRWRLCGVKRHLCNSHFSHHFQQSLHDTLQLRTAAFSRTQKWIGNRAALLYGSLNLITAADLC
jgi:hypothetical protein